MRTSASESAASNLRAATARSMLARASWIAALVGPALAIGGVHPETVAITAVVLALAHLALGDGGRASTLPRGTAIGVAAVLMTLLQWLPGGATLRAVFAPELAHRIAIAHAGTDVPPWSGFTVAPAQSAFELAVAIVALAVFVLAARHRWQRTAAAIAWLGGTLTAIGLVHGVLGKHAIYGIYRPQGIDPSDSAALLGSFVNANHQASVLVLGLACAAAMACDAARRRDDAPSIALADRQHEWVAVYLGLVALQAFALVLSLSRAAILAALMVAPLAVAIARPSRRSRRDGAAGPGLWAWAVVLPIAAALIVVAARGGAAHELATLWRSDTGLAKLAEIAEDARLLALSPWLGIGRGAFADSIGAIEANARMQTHLESIPLAMIVDWGVPVGLTVVAACCAWWIATWVRTAEPARRLVLLGLAAVAIQNSVDFGLALAGVAVPFAAAAGAVAPTGRRPHAGVSRLAALACAAAAAFAMWSAPDALARRFATDREIASGQRDASRSLAHRGLDARLHRVVARRAVEQQRWVEAHVRATAATELDPMAIDGWLLRATAAARDPNLDAGAATRATADAVRRALAVAPAPISSELATWLVDAHPTPAALVALAPADAIAWRRVAAPLADTSPWHALALVRARLDEHPDDGEALRVGVDAAFAADDPALGLHYARLWRQLAPGEAAGHLAVVRAYERFDPPRSADAIAALEQATAQIDAAGDRGTIEEWLLERLLARAEPGDRERARALVPELLRRPAPRPAVQRRNALAARAQRG